MTSRVLFSFGLVAMLVTLSGCKMLEKSKGPEIWNPAEGMTRNAEQDETKDIKFGEPVRMAIVWSNSTYTSADAPPTRGFGGRIYFFDAKNKPVRADGKLVVYAYNDSDSKESSDADRRYEYERDEFQNHHSVSELGDSYSVWVPWDRIGGMRTSITLIPIFKTADGRVVRGGQDVVVLPGSARPEDEIQKLQSGYSVGRTQITRKNKFPSRQVNHEIPRHPGGAQLQQSTSVRATTIKMNRQLGQRLAALPPNPPTHPPQAKPEPETARASQPLPRGVTPEMMRELQKHNTGSHHVTYGGFNRNVGIPPTNAKLPGNVGQPTTGQIPAQPQTNSKPDSPTVETGSRARPVYGMPGSRK